MFHSIVFNPIVFNPTAFYLGDLWQRYASKLNSELEVEGRLEAEEGVQGFCGGFAWVSVPLVVLASCWLNKPVVIKKGRKERKCSS